MCDKHVLYQVVFLFGPSPWQHGIISIFQIQPFNLQHKRDDKSGKQTLVESDIIGRIYLFTKVDGIYHY